MQISSVGIYLCYSAMNVMNSYITMVNIYWEEERNEHYSIGVEHNCTLCFGVSALYCVMSNAKL